LTGAGKSPDYYKWTQWIAVSGKTSLPKEAAVNWDPIDQTVLANEQVDVRDYPGDPVPELSANCWQWFLKITDYAEGSMT